MPASDKTFPLCKTGVEYQNANMKLKCWLNTRDYTLENQFSYMIKSNHFFGWNLHLDPRNQKLMKYDFGFNWEPATNSVVGLKHESTNASSLQLGKFFLFFFHNASTF